MRKTIAITTGLLISLGLMFYIKTGNAKLPEINISQSTINSGIENGGDLKLGAFSVSLSVRDIKKSKEFYENLGFKVFAGGLEKNYLIMKNENSLIGLFQGMFEGNILTFNPGWDENAVNIENFEDVRKIQQQLKKYGVRIDKEIDEKTSGPAGIMITDPDGNKILIDQHR